MLYPPPDVGNGRPAPPVPVPVQHQNHRDLRQAIAPDLPPVPVEPVKQRGFTFLAWLVIILLVSATVALQAVRPYIAEMIQEQTAGDQVDAAPPAKKDHITDTLTQVQVRYLIGAHSLLKQDGSEFLKQMKPLLMGGFDEELQLAIYAGELVGPKEALKSLRETAQRHTSLTREQQQLLNILHRLYTDYAELRLDAPAVSVAERELIKEHLDWAGQLALAPASAMLPRDVEAAVGAPLGVRLTGAQTPDPKQRAEVLAPAQRTFMALAGSFGTGLCLAFIGLIGVSIIGLLALNRQVRSQVRLQRGNSGIYAETFAVWMLLFMVLSIVPRLLFPEAPILLLSVTTFFMSLLAVFWPVLRGVPWRTVREEIGWTGGRHPLLEVLWGVAWYVMSLPLLVVGVVLTLVLFMIKAALEGTGPGGGTGSEAAHPIIGEIALADPLTLVVIFLLASVAAPIIEETFFRGVLYRHLRESFGRWATFLNVLFSALIVSFIFAIIHPQGPLAVPALMSLAIGFTLAREARGSLIAPMVAHGVSNGLVLSLSILLLTS
jgi:membrane protease YdiL (CAAX protease family)